MFLKLNTIYYRERQGFNHLGVFNEKNCIRYQL